LRRRLPSLGGDTDLGSPLSRPVSARSDATSPGSAKPDRISRWRRAAVWDQGRRSGSPGPMPDGSRFCRHAARCGRPGHGLAPARPDRHRPDMLSATPGQPERRSLQPPRAPRSRLRWHRRDMVAVADCRLLGRARGHPVDSIVEQAAQRQSARGGPLHGAAIAMAIRRELVLPCPS
jgi:hypothetical protein